MEYTYTHGNCIIKVWKNTTEPWHPFPWGFYIIDPEGKERRFGGIPNQCETRHSAFMRGLWRARWIEEGIFDDKYTNIHLQ